MDQKERKVSHLPRHRYFFFLQFLLLFMLASSTGLHLEKGEILQWIILFVLEMPENVNLGVGFFSMNLTPVSGDSEVY